MAEFSRNEKLRVYGVPGEELRMLVIFATTDYPVGTRPISMPGQFRVQFLMARPGRRKFSDQEPSFLTDIVGDSHLGIGEPETRGIDGDEIVGMRLQTHGDGWHIEFKCVLNDKGYLGKVVADSIYARDCLHAESVAYQALTPFLSAWSLTLDIPVLIETIQVTDLTTHTDMLNIRAPHIEMKPAGGKLTALSEEFGHFASVYREAMNSESPFYRYLCFYKIAESVYVRRNEKAKSAKLRGEQPRKYSEDVALSRDAVRGLLAMLYPWRPDWDDDLSLNQVLPAEAQGKRFKAIKDQYLEPLRNRIAHALMHTGKVESVADRLEDVNAVTKWLPLLRIWVRLLLKIEFPSEFG